MTTEPPESTVLLPARRPTAAPPRRRWPPGFTVAAGAFYMCMAGVHIGVVVADPLVYASYGEQTSFPWVRSAWGSVFMAHPALWGLFAALLEVGIGTLLLLGGRPARLGWVGVISFQMALIVFGWGYLFWIVPAAALAWLAARHDWPRLAPG